MKIVIVGAGKVGVALTRHLAVENRVTVIDQNPHLVENIINIYDVMGVCGNGASYDVQKEADVAHANLLIATTSSDEINILACLVAKPKKPLALGIGVSTVIMCFGRYLCSFLSGYIVWKDYETAFEWMEGFGWGAAIANMGENALCWLYSAVYNATYMIPETILTVIAMVVLASVAPKLFNRQG